MKKGSLEERMEKIGENLERPWVPKVAVEEEVKFCCPICDGTEYEKVERSNGVLGPGGYSWVDYCFCAGCGVMFKDPLLFTKASGK